MKYLTLLLLFGCATPLTEDEQFQKEYEENDRKIQYRLWEEWCLSEDTNGVVFSNNPSRPCRTKKCIPHKWDWNWDHEREVPKIGNAIQCVSRRQIEDFMRNL